MPHGGRAPRTARLLASAAAVAGALLGGAPPASADTTTVPLSTNTQWVIGAERGGGHEGCALRWVIRFPKEPGAESYTVTYTSEGELHLEPEVRTVTGPASKFEVSFQSPPYVPYYKAFDSPPGMLEVLGGGVEGGGYEQPEKPPGFGCEEAEPEYEVIKPTDVKVEATKTTWEVSGRLLAESCGGCEKTGVANAKVIATGTSEGGEPITETVTSDARGNWRMTLPQGTYGIAPEGSGWLPHEDQATLEQNVTQINFTHGDYTLSGKVLDAEGKGVPGVNVVFQENSPNGSTTAHTTTDGEGHFSEQLPLGTVLAAAAPSNGVEFFPVPSASCAQTSASFASGVGPVGSDGCEVNLDQDREIAFSACVLPNPDGGPLPANTPNPIPGAVTAGQLEAVGCWKPQNASGKGQATTYTSTQPVRLDGVDVVPSSGTTLQLDTAGPTVTSNGPARLKIGGWPVTPEVNIALNYQGGSTLSVGDQGAGTGPLAPNLFGLPISLGTGGPLGYGLPFNESVGSPETGGGQTTISGGLQIPLDTRATWDPAAGVFKGPAQTVLETASGDTSVVDGKTIPSLGVSGSIVTNNRQGLVLGSVCGSINDLGTEKLSPFLPSGFGDGEISGAQICWKPVQGLWEGTGMFKLPSALARFAGDIYVKFAAQKAKPNEAGQFLGYKLQSFGLQFEHLNTQTFYLYPSLTKVRESGIPLGLGFFLQSLGGEFANNLTTGRVSEIKGTAGISYGPEVNVQFGSEKGTELSLLRGDLAFTLLPELTPGKEKIQFWTYKLGGVLSFAHLSPAELQLGAAQIAFHARPEPETPEADFYAQLGGSVLGVGDTLTVSGQSDVPNGFLLEGTRTVKAFGQYTTLDAILNNYLLGVCFSANGAPLGGFDVNLAALDEGITPGCNLGSFKHPTGAASTSAVRRAVHLRLRHGLAATVLAVRGTGKAPSVRVSGPGRTLTAVPGAHPRSLNGAIVFASASKHTTYIDLLRPPAGAWAVRALPGSAAIAEVLQADPQPLPRVRAKIVRAGCADELRYRAPSTGGEHILLYAQQGSGHVYLGHLRGGGGTLKLPLLAQIKGRGKLVAYFLRGRQPAGSATLASFADAASNGSERPSHLRLHAGVLRWQQACAAAGYSVAIVRGGATTKQTTAKPRLALPAGRGAARVTVTALTRGGAALGSIRRTLK
jgi:hypothetical protein